MPGKDKARVAGRAGVPASTQSTRAERNAAFAGKSAAAAVKR